VKRHLRAFHRPLSIIGAAVFWFCCVFLWVISVFVSQMFFIFLVRHFQPEIVSPHRRLQIIVCNVFPHSENIAIFYWLQLQKASNRSALETELCSPFLNFLAQNTEDQTIFLPIY
jgi:hypothetical protein